MAAPLTDINYFFCPTFYMIVSTPLCPDSTISRTNDLLKIRKYIKERVCKKMVKKVLNASYFVWKAILITGIHNQKDVSPEVRFRGVPPGFEGLIGGV